MESIDHISFLARCLDEVLSAQRQDVGVYLKAVEKSFGASAPSTILELGCGTGAFLIRFSEVISPACVVGVDLRQDLLSLAKLKYKQGKQSFDLHLVHADFSQVNLNQEFDLILAPYASLQEVDPVQNLERVFSRVATHLKPNGVFLFDVMLREHFYAPSPRAVELIDIAPLRARTELYFKRITRFLRSKKAIDVRYSFLEIDPAGRLTNSAELRFRLHFLSYEDLQVIAQSHKLSLQEVSKITGTARTLFHATHQC